MTEIEILTKQDVLNELKEFSIFALKSKRDEIKIFWGNCLGEYRVTHNVETVMETNVLDDAIEAYNDIYISLFQT